ncbi:sigma-70 family RNA polymerase sigma factor [uncultured Gemmiger sp.]|uniref:RNA polymerase sigma factor n=1 Tax=uncultured Gemmiger sp. TaxID=1623490 RepID=UPI0025F3679A|nr:sigma-70 family RNA polymerase sigma factor [uncultured Gemmiger sp.]
MEDSAIVALYWARDEQALTESAAKFGAYCRKIALNLLGDLSDAEEVENDTWMAAWNSMPENRPARLAPYLGRITRNLALDRRDKGMAQKRGGGQAELLLEELEGCLAGPERVEHAVDAAETARMISAFLRRQPEPARGIFIRRYWYCDSMADIGARYAMPEGRVRVILHRTRSRLKKELTAQGVNV